MRSRPKKKNSQAAWPDWLRAAAKPLVALGLFLGTLLFCSLPSSVATNEPIWQPAPTQAVDPAMQDMELSLRARQAFTEDPVLADQEVGIDVRSRVATLWGTVPTREISYQAEERLRTVLGLTKIRNELHVEKTDSSRTDRLPSLQAESPLAEPMEWEKTQPQRSVARRPDENSLITSQEVLWRPVAPRPPGKAEHGEAMQTDRLPPSKTAARTPMPLVSLPGYPALDATAAPPAARQRVEQKSGDLAKAIATLRLSDPRYYRLQPEVRGGVVYLRGKAFRWDHVYELARSVSNLPGVERVVLQKIQADSE